MCDRYFVELPPREIVTTEMILEKALALLQPKDIKLHPNVFLIPFEPIIIPDDGKKSWLKSRRKPTTTDVADILRQNIRFMIKKTRNFGLLLCQLSWVGLLSFAEKRRVLQHFEDELSIADLYITMLKKDINGLTQFINCLHMTGNHQIGNKLEQTEEKLELLASNLAYSEDAEECIICIETSSDEWHGHYLPPKKRKTSADSGFDDIEDEEQDIENSLAPGVPLKYKCNIRPLDAVEVIAIINGEEDSHCKVELCKCGHYHQYPKWKEMDTGMTSRNTRDNKYTLSTYSGTSDSGFEKCFAKKGSNNADRRSSTKPHPKHGILSPVSQPVEMGSDLSKGLSQTLEFTQPRRNCSHLKLRFSAINRYAEHPDNVEDQTSSSHNKGDTIPSLKSRLPRFLRQLFV